MDLFETGMRENPNSQGWAGNTCGKPSVVTEVVSDGKVTLAVLLLNNKQTTALSPKCCFPSRHPSTCCPPPKDDEPSLCCLCIKTDGRRFRTISRLSRIEVIVVSSSTRACKCSSTSTSHRSGSRRIQVGATTRGGGRTIAEAELAAKST